ncbi:MAG: HEPN domain-containing protein [Thermoplasmatales archaeon]|nr:HEPN domain-containing protein [Thermoplasmatales archaeon]
MGYEFERCLEKRKIVKENISEDMLLNEVNAADYDLAKAKNSLDDGDYKWATVQAYYVMFHSAMALVFSKGFRERSHYCLKVALMELFVNTNKLEPEYVEFFEDTMLLREQADYELRYYPSAAEEPIKNAERFLQKTKEILGP